MHQEHEGLIRNTFEELDKEQKRFQYLYIKDGKYITPEYTERVAVQIETEWIVNPLAVFTHIPNPQN